MATSIGKAILEVVADFSDVDKKLPDAESKLDRLGQSMTRFGALGIAATGAAALGLSKFGSAAADQNAAMAALVQVTGDASGAIGEWAKDSVRAVGLSRRAALEAATQFGGIAKAAGLSADEVARWATEQTQLSADLAAFKNVSPEQAIQDLQSAYAGSSEVLRKYNIFLDDATLKAAYFRETGEQVSGTLTAQQRIIATHSEIMRQSTDMQGQWNREIGEAPAQQAMLKASLEDLQASIGQGVLPVMTNLLEGANKVVGAFNNLDDGTKSAIGTFATWATAGVGVVSSLSFISGQVIKLQDRLMPMGADGERSFNRLGKAAAAAGGVIAVVGIAATLKEISDASTGLTLEIDKLARATDEELRKAFRDTIIPLGEFNNAVDKMADAGAVGSMERLSEVVELNGDQQEYLSAAIAKTVDGLQQQRDDTDRTAAAVDEYGKTTESVRRVNADFVIGLDEVASALNDEISALFGVESATSNYEAAVADLGEALKENGPTLDLTSEKGRDNAQAFRDVVTATGELIAKQVEEGRSSQEVQATLDAQKAKLGELATQYGIPIGEVERYISALDNIPALKSTQLQLDIRAHVNEIANAIDYDVRAGAQARALGGPVTAGVPYWVGEQNRPELFVPSVSGHIYNEAQLASGFGGENHYHLTTVVQESRASVEEQFRRMELIAGFN